MNERLPYEESLAHNLGDLPLPDENMAWEDMSRRLDEDRRRRIIPFWLNGCLGWGLIGLLAVGLAWWILRPAQWFDSKDKTVQAGPVKKNEISATGDTIAVKDEKTISILPEETDDTGTDSNTKDSTITGNVTIPGINPDQQQDQSSVYEQQGAPGSKGKKSTGKPKQAGPSNTDKNKTKGKNKPVKTEQENEDHKIIEPNDTDREEDRQKVPEPGDSITTAEKSPVPVRDSSTNIKTDGPGADTISGSKRDTVVSDIQKRDTSAIAKTVKDSSVKQPLTFSAGIGIYQQIPVGGQTMVPYNSLGRKGTLMDYIPSLYFRLNKAEKWFLQSEFRYGAPQYTKELLYKQQTDTNQVTQKVMITSTRIQKTYYHQLPVTFNYYVLPGWSVGAGVSWNRFNSAVSGLDLTERDLGTGQDTLIGPLQVFRIRKADSNFVKSYWQAVFETSYKRKRFSAGLRYSFGLQPYIKFTLPGGVQQEEKNSSLQLFIRYELWRQKK